MLTKCSQCNKSFETFAYKIKKHKHLFCSTICQHKFRKKRVKLVCRICNKPFDIQKYRTITQKECFCSAKCAYKALKTSVFLKLPCKICGKEFKIRESRLKYAENHYCSRDCAFEAQKREVKCICKNCNKEFIVTESVKKDKKGCFCSRKCVNEFYSKNHAPHFKHGHGYFKKLSKKRSNLCEVCCKKGKTEVHHIDGNQFNNVESNFITLCRSCHMRIHNLSGRHEVPLEKALEIFKTIKDLPLDERSTWLKIENLKQK